MPARTPKLIHPVDVVIELMNRDNSVFDKYAREPVGQVVRNGESPGVDGIGNRITLKAQVSFYFAGAKESYPSFERGGVNEISDLYITVRYVDLLKEGLIAKDTDGSYINMQIKRGDRVVQHGRVKCDYYVTGFKPFAYYPKHGQTMLQINLTDRHPGYQEGDL